MILKLNFSSDIPIYQQIRDQIVLGVADGRLRPGEKLPTIRTLADECGVNVMTVNKAYALLKSEGVITADRRSGAHIRRTDPDAEGMIALSDRVLRELKLAASEAKLAGLDRESFLKMCADMYEGI